jgi:hypothetical protein
VLVLDAWGEVAAGTNERDFSAIRSAHSVLL